MSATPKPQEPKLTTKQKAFVCAYLQCFNAAKAARQAGYSLDSAKQAGTDNLAKPYIAAEIHRRLDSEGITPERIKIAYADIAFDADIADFEDIVFEGKKPSQLREDGLNTKLIKSLTQNKYGIKVEMYSRKDALDSLARVRGMNLDKMEHSGRVDSLITQEKFGDMDNERKARLLRTAGLADVLGEDDGADPGTVDTGGG